jgi:hypothetical protein
MKRPVRVSGAGHLHPKRLCHVVEIGYDFVGIHRLAPGHDVAQVLWPDADDDVTRLHTTCSNFFRFNQFFGSLGPYHSSDSFDPRPLERRA